MRWKGSERSDGKIGMEMVAREAVERDGKEGVGKGVRGAMEDGLRKGSERDDGKKGVREAMERRNGKESKRRCICY